MNARIRRLGWDRWKAFRNSVQTHRSWVGIVFDTVKTLCHLADAMDQADHVFRAK